MTEPIAYVAGGTVQAGGGLYIRRRTDEILLELCRRGIFAYLLTPRQMGKSSLMVQTATQLAAEGIRSVTVDLTQIGTELTAEAWYLGVLTLIVRQLKLTPQLVQWWRKHQHLGVTQRLTQFFEQIVLAEISDRIVIFVDEIDTTLSLSFTDDFFIAIRYFYIARARNTIFERLSFVLIGVATPDNLIRDPRRTPFNIGQRVDLDDFTLAEAQPFAAGLRLPPHQAESVLHWVIKWTNGHPYLTQRLCTELVAQIAENADVSNAAADPNKHPWTEAAVGQLVHQTFLGTNSDQDNNLQFVQDMLTKQAPNPLAVMKTYRQIRQGHRPVPDEEQSLVKAHLKLSGIVRRDGRNLKLRNAIYRHIFNRRWIRHHLPENRWEQLKPAMPLIAILSVLSIAMAALARYAFSQQRVAEVREQTAVVLNWLPTPKAAQGLVLAIYAMDRSQKLAPSASGAAQSSLLSAAVNAKEQNLLPGHGSGIRSVAFSPDGQRIVSSSEDGSIRLWDAQGNLIGQPFQGSQSIVYVVAFSPDGRRIVSGSEDGSIRLWDIQGNPIGEPFQGQQSAVYSVAFSPDSQRIVSGSENSSIRLWDIQGNPIGQPFQGHQAAVWSVAFSPDGQRIVSGGEDDSIRLWDIQGNPIGKPFQGHQAAVWSVAFSPDGQRIVSSSEDGSVRLWDVQGDPIGQPFRGHQAVSYAVTFSADGQRIVSGSRDYTIRLWDTQGNPIGQPFQGHEATVWSVAFSPDGQRIVSGSEDGSVRLWDAESYPIGQPFQGHEAAVSFVAFSPDGQRIISSSSDNTVRLWDIHGNPIGQPFQGHEAAVWSAAFSPDGRRIVSGSLDGTIRLWDTQGNPIGLPVRTDAAVLAVAFSADGQRIVSGNGDNTIRVWDTQGNPIGSPFQGHEHEVSSVAFSPSQQYIVSGSLDGSIRLWDTQGNPIGSPFQGHEHEVWSVAFSPDEQYIISSSKDSSIRLWDIRGNLIGQPFNHEAVVWSVAFSADGQRIVSGSGDGTIRLWDIRGNPIGQPFRHEAPVYSVAFSPDDQHIVSGSRDGTIRLWYQSWEGWFKLACNRLRDHPLLQQREQSFDLRVTKGARRACEQRVWGRESVSPWQQVVDWLVRFF